ncbi:acyltransferase family protein [Streptococcus merionis]|uniref:Membrane protein n=1 Tax=Streptococcus merionis TaxID=400065 RepID=A0A239SRV9_9STRE|nr:acyltransferase family protein [Streptococcus merionis]SNU87454.1 membrane protein [Streptococcus merionis]
MTNYSENAQVNTNLLSLCQFMLAILVIALHCQRIFENDSLHFIQKSLFSRLAVPFFMLSTGFFLAKAQKEGRSLKQWAAKFGKTYLFWSVFYLPYALSYFAQTQLSISFFPAGLLVALLYTGTCYHLWYLAAVLEGVCLLSFLEKYLNSKIVFLICLSLYSFGLLETYFAYLDDSGLGVLYQNYQKIFYTARNALFFAPIFLYLGAWTYHHYRHPILVKRLKTKLSLSLLAFIGEGWLIFQNQGIDKNFFLSLIPVTLLLFNWAIRSSLFREKAWQKLKAYSVYYFFLHPIFVEISFAWLNTKDWPIWTKGQLAFVIALILTHALSSCILHFRAKGLLKIGSFG